MANSSCLESIKAKIRALRAKTVANGCTEAEALAAAAAAFALMQRHGLDDDLAACTRDEAPLGRSRRSPIDALLPLIAWCCHCQHHLRQDHPRGPLQSVFVGRDPWPEVATWLQGVVAGAADRALRDYRKIPDYRRRRSTATRATARRHFMEGFVEALRNKLWRLKMDAGDNEQQTRDLELAKRALAQTGVALRSLDALGKARGGRRYDAARAQGSSAGHAVEVRWGVQGGAAPLAIAGNT